MYRWFMIHEWNRLGFEAEVISFPPRHDRQLCWDDPEAELADGESLKADTSVVIARITRAQEAGKRVWLIAHGEPAGSRWEVDKHFFSALHAAGIGIHPQDEWAGLAELAASPE
jgi:hypothetical protein